MTTATGTLSRYKQNLAKLVTALQSEHSEKIGEPLSIRKLAERVNTAIAPALGEEAELAYQSIQAWQRLKYKGRMEPRSSQIMGVFLGLPASSAGKSLELFLNEFEGEISPPVGGCVGKFLRERPGTQEEAAGTYGVPLVAIENSDLAQLKKHEERLILDHLAIVRRLEELITQTPPSLNQVVWHVLENAPGGKFRANLGNPAAVAKELAKKAVNFNVGNMRRILEGDMTALDLTAAEMQDIATGLNRASADTSWTGDRLIRILKYGWSETPPEKA